MAIRNALQLEMQALEQQIASLEDARRGLPRGSLVLRKVKGHAYYYLVHRENGKVVTKYKGKMNSEEVLRYANAKVERKDCSQRIQKAQKDIRLLRRVLRRLDAEPDASSEMGQKGRNLSEDAIWSRSVKEKEDAIISTPLRRTSTLVKRKSPLIALSGGFDRNPFIDIAREWGWDLVDLQITQEAVPDDPVPSGAIVTHLPTHPVVLKLRKLGCPVVRLGWHRHPDDAGLAVLLFDSEAAGRVAAVHFADRGFRSMGYVGWDPANREAFMYPMFMGFKKTAEAYGGSVGVKALRSVRNIQSKASASKYEHQVVEISNWLKDLPRPFAVMGHNDFMAAKICVACKRIGIGVPEEVALLGAGNNRTVCELSPVPISSVDMGYETRSRIAMQTLRNMINGDDAPTAPILIRPNGVVQRRSSDLLAVRDPVVASALRFMWDHFDQNMSVNDIAGEVGVNRRTLERVFGRSLGRSVNAELRRKRLEHCRRLLATTSLSVADIAPQCGFSSAAYLGSVFREEFGTTPHKWRNTSGL